MNKKNATIILIAMILFPIFGWYRVFAGQQENQEKLAEYVKMAEFYEEKGIYIDAVNSYQEAQKLDPKNEELILKQADLYLKLGDKNGFLKKCDELNSLDYKNPVPYIRKIEYYMSVNDFKNALKIAKTAKKNTKDNEEIANLVKELSKKSTQKYCSFTGLKSWHVQKEDGYLAAEENGKWGLISKDGTKKIKLQYDFIGAYDEATGVVPCKDGELWYYMDAYGNKKLISDEPYTYLGSFGDGLAPAQKAGKYGYINTKFEEQKFEFDYAGPFVNGLAAVKKNDKWALINKDLNTVTDFVYDEIKLDANDFCAHFNLLVARQGDKYFLMDHEGKKVGAQTFDDICLPASNDQPIAVLSGKKWGFVDQEGKMVIEAKYDKAKSFCHDLAPIEKNERWGFIDLQEQLIVENKYDDADVFSTDGSAPVAKTGFWSFLILCEYDK